MMTLTDVRVTVGDRDLLVNANLRVEPGETVGLVGANGCGKSTLLRCVSGIRSHDAGELRVAQRADVGYLEQTAVSGSKLTVAEEARSRMTHVKAAQDAVRAAEDAMEKGDPNAAATLVAANDAFEAVGGNTVERRVSDVLTGLGFAKEAWDRPCAALSGGWQMRVALARLLLSPAGDSQNSGITGGFLLLDEPTNHLDAQAKEWLAGWLRAYTGTVLLVSHDEALLDRGVDRLVEVRGSRLHGYSGNYQKFLEERKKNREVAARAASKEAAKAAKLEQFVAKNSARASTAKAAKSKAKQLQGVLENLEELEEATGGGKELGSGPGDAKRVTFRLPDPPDGAKEALILDNAVVGYGTGLEPLITNAAIKVSRGDRWLIVGPNGAGKSTLLRTLGGNLRLQGGTLAHGEGTRVGYFSQDLAQELPIDATPLAHVLTVARAADPTVTELTARSVLGALGPLGRRREGTKDRGPQRRREGASRPRRVRAAPGQRPPPGRGVQPPGHGGDRRPHRGVAGMAGRRRRRHPQRDVRGRPRADVRGEGRERVHEDEDGHRWDAVQEGFLAERGGHGRGGGRGGQAEEGGGERRQGKSTANVAGGNRGCRGGGQGGQGGAGEGAAGGEERAEDDR
jgi:ATPase subunit of ABC transporter with duplicated ATPase domains